MHFESWGFLSKPFSFSGAKNDSLTVHYFSQPCQLLIGGNQRTVVTSLMFEQLEGTATQNKNNHRYLNQCHPKRKVWPFQSPFFRVMWRWCVHFQSKKIVTTLLPVRFLSGSDTRGHPTSPSPHPHGSRRSIKAWPMAAWAHRVEVQSVVLPRLKAWDFDNNPGILQEKYEKLVTTGSLRKGRSSSPTPKEERGWYVFVFSLNYIR